MHGRESQLPGEFQAAKHYCGDTGNRKGQFRQAKGDSGGTFSRGSPIRSAMASRNLSTPQSSTSQIRRAFCRSRRPP